MYSMGPGSAVGGKKRKTSVSKANEGVLGDAGFYLGYLRGRSSPPPPEKKKFIITVY